MVLQTIDWVIIALYFAVTLAVGLLFSARAGRSSSEFFLGGRSMPWWLLGASMVATTFSTDTPNLVTDIVRTHGVSGNWLWWTFLLTGMLTVFVYAKLWRRSEVLTDVEFYEIRYSGKAAAFLRGFRALYLGVFFNVMIMATVSLAAIKIGGVLLAISPAKTIVVAMVVTALFCSVGGLRAVLITDVILFSLAMAGSVAAAVMACRHPLVGGLKGLFSNPAIADRLSLIPLTKTGGGWRPADRLVSVFLIPLAVQWWSVWYPGAEPGGGGYIAQRMLSAKDERHAMGATLLFNVCHYALRPWPWIIVALASLIVFPDLDSIRQAFPRVRPEVVGNDTAYPAMLAFLPNGLLGLVLASLIAAYMSTISTHLNWGASYVVNDFYRRFVRPDASERQLVLVGRIATAGLMVLAALGALLLSNALQAFHILLQVGAGTGLIFILRWFWWRINAWTEITAMSVSFLVAVYAELIHPHLGYAPWPEAIRLLVGVGLTTLCWLAVTFLTPPTDDKVLRRFYRLVRPGGPGWRPVVERARMEGDPIEKTATQGDLPRGILCMLIGSAAVYSALFGMGYLLYGRWQLGLLFGIVAVLAVALIRSLWGRLEMR
ncbi:MAG: Na+:solute symporter [Sedimentisphaerales bacterium]|nr:Na+:solute symporter [Sedimentisphaerales bacterium]